MSDHQTFAASPEGIERIHHGIREIEVGLGETARETKRRYDGLVGRAGDGVARVVSTCASRLDGAAGDAPWRIVGMDRRRTRIARRVLTEIVPATAGDRASSFLDGVAIKAGAGGAGILLRLPLKPVVVPILAVLAAVETVKVVADIRRGVADVAAAVDAEMEKEDADVA